MPALDAVAFADPRRSQVDIVQAVGRAMRKPRGASSKTTGYIILPVFLSKKELKDPETAVEGSAFAPVLQVLRALKAHDPYRATFFAKILVEEGKRPHKKGEGLDEILQVSIGKELDRALAKRLEQAVQLRAVEVAAVHQSANTAVIAGLGYTGILVSFVARHNPWAIPPVALLFGGFAAAGSLLQRRMGLPDASVLVLQGFAFVFILAAEALRGRLFGLFGVGLARSVKLRLVPGAAA